MKLKITMTKAEANRIRRVYDEKACGVFVRHRFERNIRRVHKRPGKADFWRAMMAGLLTSGKKSGPESAVGGLLLRDHFPLSLQRCKKHQKIKTYIQEVLIEEGTGSQDQISGYAVTNLAHLNSGGWSRMLEIIAALYDADSKELERECASELTVLSGIGPKQSRNMLQMLGLTRYEIPLDSRIGKWLTNNAFPLPVSPRLLSDPAFYDHVMDTVQLLCDRIDVPPTLFDAAIFASSDGDQWERHIRCPRCRSSRIDTSRSKKPLIEVLQSARHPNISYSGKIRTKYRPVTWHCRKCEHNW